MFLQGQGRKTRSPWTSALWGLTEGREPDQCKEAAGWSRAGAERLLRFPQPPHRFAHGGQRLKEQPVQMRTVPTERAGPAFCKCNFLKTFKQAYCSKNRADVLWNPWGTLTTPALYQIVNSLQTLPGRTSIPTCHLKGAQHTGRITDLWSLKLKFFKWAILEFSPRQKI